MATTKIKKAQSSKSRIVAELSKATKVPAENVAAVLKALQIDKTLNEASSHSSAILGLKEARFAVRLSKNTVSV
jgi:hypothetical protein